MGHISHEVLIPIIHGDIQQVKALIHGDAMSIFISLSLLRTLEQPHEPALTSTQGPNGQVMMAAKESQKVSLLVQYFEHLKPVDKSEVLVVPMKELVIVFGLPWFKARTPEICWTKGQLTALLMQNGQQWAKIPELEGTSHLLEHREEHTHVEPHTDI
jgi:hypothetical protein